MILVDEGLRKHDPCRKGNKRQNVKADNISERVVTSAPKLEQSGGVSATSAPKYGKTDDKTANGVVSRPDKSTVLMNKTLNTAKQHYGKQIRRTIPIRIKRDIWKRDEGRCAYVNPKTGRKCGSRYLLQIDHIKPFAFGGGSERENLRLLCAGHNRFRCEKPFSRE